MPRTGSAKRYAEVIFGLARERGELEPWVSRLQVLVELVQDEGLRSVLESPSISLEEKVGLIRQAIPQQSPLLQNLMALLTSRQHLRLAPLIMEEYQRLSNAAQGIEVAQVTTAVPLEADERASIASRLAQLVQREVRVQSRVDPAILGGFIARLGDRLIDGSTRTRLQELRRQLAAGSR